MLDLLYQNWLMYDFHYNFIKKHFDAELLYAEQIQIF